MPGRVEAQLAQDAAGDQILAHCVTNVVRGDDELGAFGIWCVIVRMGAKLEFLSIR